MSATQTNSQLEADPREKIAGEAFAAGRRSGFAIAALILSIVSFISLLGTEKAILAITLGVLAIRGAQPGTSSRRLAGAAIGIGAMFLVTVAVILTVYWDKVGEFIALLEKLS
jgi:hypothetical protein